MAAGNPIADLMRMQAQSAALQQAGSFGTGHGFLDTIRPIVDFLAGAQQSYASGSNSGNAIAGLGGMVQGMSKRNYLNQLQEQQKKAFAYQQYLDTQAANKRSNTIKGINNLAQGQPLDFDPNSDVDTVAGILPDYLRQLGAVTNFYNRDSAVDGVTTGQDASRFGSVLNPAAVQALNGAGGSVGPPAAESLAPMNLPPTMDEAMSMDPNAQQFTAGASYKAPPSPPAFAAANPFTLPTDSPAVYSQNVGRGLEDIQSKATLDETARKNTNDYTLGQGELGVRQGQLSLDQKELQAKIAGNYFKNYPPAGPGPRAPNAVDFARQLISQGYSPEQAAQMAGLSSSTGGGEVKNIETAMKLHGGLVEAAKIQYGEGSPQHKQAIAAAAAKGVQSLRVLGGQNQTSQQMVPRARQAAGNATAGSRASFSKVDAELGLKRR